ncbi:MAG: SDR family NAD(P)-dependent oxidoreductase [Thermoanaerobaculia bacterium]
MSSAPSRLAWVTGGSRGIGRVIVERLVRDGWRVAFTWRAQEASAREVEAACEGRAVGWSMDLSDPRGPESVLTEIEDRLGPVDALINNAGHQHSELLALTREEDLQRLIEVNLAGAVRCCRAVLKGMVSRRGGAIVNVSSLTALRGVSGQAAYGAVKAGLLGLTRSLAREVGRKSVRVNAVVPGFVATELTGELPARAVELLRSQEALPYGVEAADVAAAVAFLISDDARAITGQSLVVDAGVYC